MNTYGGNLVGLESTMVLNTPCYSSHMLENRFLLEFDMVASDGLLEAGSESSMFQGSSGLSAKESSYSVA